MVGIDKNCTLLEEADYHLLTLGRVVFIGRVALGSHKFSVSFQHSAYLEPRESEAQTGCMPCRPRLKREASQRKLTPGHSAPVQLCSRPLLPRHLVRRHMVLLIRLQKCVIWICLLPLQDKTSFHHITWPD